MKHTIKLSDQPGIRKGNVIWVENGKQRELDLSTGPYLVRIEKGALVLEREADAGYSLESLGLRIFTFMWDELLFGMEEGQTQMWFGEHQLPDPDQSIMGFHGIGTGDIIDSFPNKVGSARQIAVNLSYDSSVFQASIGRSKDTAYGIVFKQSSELYHGLRRIPKPRQGIYQPRIS